MLGDRPAGPLSPGKRAQQEPDAGHALAVRRHSRARLVLTTGAIVDVWAAQEIATRARVAGEIKVKRCVSIA